MKGKKVLSALLLALFVSQVYAQEEINPEDAVTTQHQGTFNGNSISYSATIGHQPVWDKDGNIIAGLNYTYYEKNGDIRYTVLSNIKKYYGVNSHYTERPMFGYTSLFDWMISQKYGSVQTRNNTEIDNIERQLGQAFVHDFHP